MESNEKFRLQDSQYSFPYHWLPELRPDRSISMGRAMSWGLEYLTYMEAVAHTLLQQKPKSVLDIGCGDGRLSGFLPPSIEYVGVDLSENAISLAKVLSPAGTFANQVLPAYYGRFDVVAAIEVIEHVPDEGLESFIEEAKKLLAPGGCFLISVPTTNLPLHKKHFRHYTAELLSSQLGPHGFVVESYSYVYKVSRLTGFLKAILCNHYWVLNTSWVTRAIWKFHKRFGYVASQANGAHLIARAKLSL